MIDIFYQTIQIKAVSKFKRHSRSLSQQSLNKLMADVKKEDALNEQKKKEEQVEDLAETTKNLSI
jgi:hypothetical protein